MLKAVIIEEFGGPEVMQMVDSQVSPPSSHEVTIRNTAIGLLHRHISSFWLISSGAAESFGY